MMDILFIGLLIMVFFSGMFCMDLVHIRSQRKQADLNRKWERRGFIKVKSTEPVKMYQSTTTFGNTIKYPNQKPEDIFSYAELAEWAIRNGWKELPKVEIFRGKK